MKGSQVFEKLFNPLNERVKRCLTPVAKTMPNKIVREKRDDYGISSFFWKNAAVCHPRVEEWWPIGKNSPIQSSCKRRTGVRASRRDATSTRNRDSGVRQRWNTGGVNSRKVLTAFPTGRKDRVALIAGSSGQFRHFARSWIRLLFDQQGSEFLHPIRSDHWLAGASQDDGRIDSQHPERIDHTVLEVPEITRGLGDELLEVTLRISIIEIDGGVNQPVLERG